MMMMMSLCQWTMTQMWNYIEKMLEEILHASDTREHASRSEILKTHFDFDFAEELFSEKKD